MYKLLGVLILFLLPIWVSAQTLDPATQDLITKLQARIDALEKRVAELEREKPAAPAAAAPAPTAATQMAHAHDQAPVPTTVQEAAQPVYPSLKIEGFSDFNFS